MNNIILASFPKSGNTWVRFLVANIYNEMKKTFDEVDFHNIHLIIPEIGSEVKEPYFNDLPKVFKTHDVYSTDFHRVILILRNPYDTLFSYYCYLNCERDIEISLPELIYHESFGIKGIINYANSYIKKTNNLLLLTYERLYNDTLKELRRICRFAQIEVLEHHLPKAVENSSFSSMRRIEVNKGRKFGKSDFLFTRSGKIGEGIQEIKKFPEALNYAQQQILKSAVLELLYL